MKLVPYFTEVLLRLSCGGLGRKQRSETLIATEGDGNKSPGNGGRRITPTTLTPAIVSRCRTLWAETSLRVTTSSAINDRVEQEVKFEAGPTRPRRK